MQQSFSKHYHYSYSQNARIIKPATPLLLATNRAIRAIKTAVISIQSPAKLYCALLHLPTASAVRDIYLWA